MRSRFLSSFCLSLLTASVGVGQSDALKDNVNSVSPNDVYFIAPGASNILEAGIRSEGGKTLVSWVDSTPDQSALMIRELEGAAWGVPKQIRLTTTAHISTLATELSPTGGTQVVWVELSETGIRSLQFADSISDDVQTIVETPLTVDSVSFRELGGKPFIAWSEGGAGVFASFLAYQENNQWNVVSLSEEVPSYDILPQVLRTSPPSVLWYSLQHSGFQLQSLQQSAEEWVSPAQALDFLPTQRLPVLFDVPNSELPGAFWIEPSTEGDQMNAFDPRVESANPFLSLPLRAGVQHLDPEAASSNGAAPELAFAWVEETVKDRYVILRVRDQEYLVSSVPAPKQPRISWYSENQLQLVVPSDQTRGGDGQLYFANIFLTPTP